MEKVSERIKIARQFQKQMADLEKQRNRLFNQALRKLKIIEPHVQEYAWDYFYNNQVGLNSFEESLKDATAL